MIPNSKGTAIGMALKHNDTDLFILPGVPAEMKNMYHEHVSKKFIDPFFKENKIYYNFNSRYLRNKALRNLKRFDL